MKVTMVQFKGSHRSSLSFSRNDSWGRISTPLRSVQNDSCVVYHCNDPALTGDDAIFSWRLETLSEKYRFTTLKQKNREQYSAQANRIIFYK